MQFHCFGPPAVFQYNNVSQLPSVVGGGALTFTKLETIPKGKVRSSLKLSRKGKFDWNHITKPNTPSPVHGLVRKVFILRRKIVCVEVVDVMLHFSSITSLDHLLNMFDEDKESFINDCCPLD